MHPNHGRVYIPVTVWYVPCGQSQAEFKTLPRALLLYAILRLLRSLNLPWQA
jgi:hypothetical protein